MTSSRTMTIWEQPDLIDRLSELKASSQQLKTRATHLRSERVRLRQEFLTLESEYRRLEQHWLELLQTSHLFHKVIPREPAPTDIELTHQSQSAETAVISTTDSSSREVSAMTRMLRELERDLHFRTEADRLKGISDVALFEAWRRGRVLDQALFEQYVVYLEKGGLSPKAVHRKLRIIRWWMKRLAPAEQ